MNSRVVMIVISILLMPEISFAQQTDGVPLIAGKYRSEITDNTNRVLGHAQVLVDLSQDGTEFTGVLVSDDFYGEVWGRIEDHSLKFEWYTDEGLGGRGTWTIGDDASTLSGKWYKSGSRYVGGEWDLYRI